MNIFNIENAFESKKNRKWEKLFWAIDLHDTIITGKYNRFNVGSEIYPGAVSVLQWLNARPDMCSILYTSSHKDAATATLERLKLQYGIHFDYFNENPECPSTDLCDFSTKFYYNILLDDKAGFSGEVDWINIKNELIRIGEWNK